MDPYKRFIQQYNLSEKQVALFQQYQKMLLDWNEVMNLTAITDPDKIIQDHFMDSLAVTRAMDMQSINGLADVGTGGGFPGIPLKIMFPDCLVILIEVVQKKVTFLEHVIKELKLDRIQIAHLDWRTFLRSTDYPIDLFCARASLAPDELIRAFKPNCDYKDTQIVYWASKQWEPTGAVSPYITREFVYEVGAKKRRLIFLNAEK